MNIRFAILIKYGMLDDVYMYKNLDTFITGHLILSEKKIINIMSIDLNWIKIIKTGNMNTRS